MARNKTTTVNKMYGATDTRKEVSFLRGIFWDCYERLVGPYTMDTIHDPKVEALIEEFVNRHLPHLRRMSRAAEERNA